MLEVVLRLISDLQTKFVDIASKSSNDLLAVHANLIFILSEFLAVIPETQIQRTEDDDDQDLNDSDDEVDLAKTRDTIWSLLTGSYQQVL